MSARIDDISLLIDCIVGRVGFAKWLQIKQDYFDMRDELIREGMIPNPEESDERHS
jgi:hypothetical protein